MRNLVRGGGAATAALALLTLSGCLSSPTSRLHAPSGAEGRGAVVQASARTNVTPKSDRASIMGVSPAGMVSIGDQDGVVRGVASDKELDRIQDAAGRVLGAAGIASVVERDGKPVVNEEAQRLGDAVMAIEAVPVQDAGGMVVGYMGAGFIELRDYEAVKADAERTVVEMTGKAYPSS